MSMFTSGNIALAPNGPMRPEYDTYAVTPSDGTDLVSGSGNARFASGLICTVGGNVNVNLRGGGTAVLTTLVANVRYQIEITRILATSTTATGIFATF